MRHSSCRYRIDQIKRRTNDVQLYSMFVQILRGSRLPVRMPERQSPTPDDRLPVRECLQVRPAVQMQGRVIVEGVSRIVPSSRPVCRSCQYATPLQSQKGANHA